jgi:MFS family permease
VLGCLVNAGAQALWLSRIQAQPAYLTHLLPAQLIGGIGVGLSIPSLLGAGSASLPPARFGAGSGILNMARQVGTVLGVAALVAILATLGPDNPVPVFRHALVLIIAFFACAGLVSAAFLTGGQAPMRVLSLDRTDQTAHELALSEDEDGERGDHGQRGEGEDGGRVLRVR